MITASDSQSPNTIIKYDQSRNCYGLITDLVLIGVTEVQLVSDIWQNGVNRSSWSKPVYINRKYSLGLLKWNNKNSVLKFFFLFQKCILKSKIVDMSHESCDIQQLSAKMKLLKFGFIILPIYKDAFSCPQTSDDFYRKCISIVMESNYNGITLFC